MNPAVFRDVFLPGEELTRFVCFMCNAMANSVTDPITHALYIMISKPLSLVLTQVGIAPFKGESTVIYPYRMMNDVQKDFLRECVQQTKQDVAGVMASVQIGGGCILYSKRREGQQDTFLHTPDVLQAFCRAVFRSKTHTNDRVRSSICNLFVQRVSSMVNMDNSVVRRIEEEIKALAGKGQVGLNGRD